MSTPLLMFVPHLIFVLLECEKKANREADHQRLSPRCRRQPRND